MNQEYTTPTMFNRIDMQLEKRLYKEGYAAVVGVDEVGRGAWAGPLLACAVVMPVDSRVNGVRDSKVLSPKKREKIAARIQECASAIAIGIVHNNEIDQLGIVTANELAMQRAVDGLGVDVDYLLVDAFQIPGFSGVKQHAIAHGDAIVYSIGAASIVAKVTRDRMMEELHEQYPKYGFDQHKGYGTDMHARAIERYGVTPLHRMSFHPMKTML